MREELQGRLEKYARMVSKKVEQDDPGLLKEVRYEGNADLSANVEGGHKFLWYTYSQTNVTSFTEDKYKGMKVENTLYVYDKKGSMLVSWNAPTLQKSIRGVKWYIIKKIIYRLRHGEDPMYYSKRDRDKMKRHEWGNLREYIKSKFKKK